LTSSFVYPFLFMLISAMQVEKRCPES
jgi:hypothetical protein